MVGMGYTSKPWIELQPNFSINRIYYSQTLSVRLNYLSETSRRRITWLSITDAVCSGTKWCLLFNGHQEHSHRHELKKTGGVHKTERRPQTLGHHRGTLMKIMKHLFGEYTRHVSRHTQSNIQGPIFDQFPRMITAWSRMSGDTRYVMSLGWYSISTGRLFDSPTVTKKTTKTLSINSTIIQCFIAASMKFSVTYARKLTLMGGNEIRTSASKLWKLTCYIIYSRT